MSKTAEQLWKERGTPMKKLNSLDFWVFLYALEAPRRYEGLPLPNTIGFGYYGKDECMAQGIATINEQVNWLRENRRELQVKHGNHFPDCAQYEVYARFAGDEKVIGGRLMTEDECYGKVRDLLDGKHG